MVNVSVVVPTLNEEDNLPNLFAALAGQLEEGDEVIVVDAGSSDDTIDIAKKAGARVYLYEDSSVGKARGLGSDVADNEVIASTDADSIPPDGWLDRIKYHFENDEDLVVLWGNIEDVNGVPIRNLIGKYSTITGGASGNNTAFRKSAYEKLSEGYPDISFLEDSVVIGRLSSIGKAKRDGDLVMRMNMDRRRYQTLPIVASGIVGLVGSRFISSPVGDVLQGMSTGAVGTELVYEGMTDTDLHHDQVGAGIASIGKNMDGRNGKKVMGLGSGILVHHVLTEGVSAMPTQLFRNTDEEV